MVVGDLPVEADVIVLGAGPGGYTAALRAAELGRQVLLVDPGLAGGRCLRDQCIPSKALLSAAGQFRRLSSLSAMGIGLENPTVDLARMQAWKEEIVQRLGAGVARLLAQAGVETAEGRGWFLNGQELRVETEYSAQRYRFQACVVATGAVPQPLPGQPFDGASVLTPAQAYSLSALPAGLTVAAADPQQEGVAAEIATFYADVGVPVGVALPAEGKFLGGFEPGAAARVRRALQKRGVTFGPLPGDGLEPSPREPLVVCGGIAPDVEGLALEEAGVALDERGFVQIDERLQTTNPAVFAVGDVAGGPGLASLAMAQGRTAAEALCGWPAVYAPQAIPQVLWTDPQLARVGLTAAEAEGLGYGVEVARVPLGANGRAHTLGATDGVLLLLAEADTGVLLGASVAGPQAEALIGEAALALEMGATATDVAATVHPHPSLSEGWQAAALMLLDG